MEQLIALFGNEYVRIDEPIGTPPLGLVAFRRPLGHTSTATVCTLGLKPRELVCTVDEEHLPAAVGILKIAVARQQQELHDAWPDGRPWLNDQPILGGTTMQALVVRQGEVDEVFALSEAEGMIVATNSRFALDLALARDPKALLDPFRDELWPAEEISDEALNEVGVLTSTLARTKPLREVHFTQFNRFLALTGEEPAGFLDDPANIEVRPATELLAKLYGARTFFARATPGERIWFTSAGWQYSIG